MILVFVETEAQPLRLKGPKIGIYMSYILTSYSVNVYFIFPIRNLWSFSHFSQVLICLHFFILILLLRKKLCTNIAFSTATHRFTGDTVYGFPGWHLGEYRGGGLVASSAIPVTSIGLDYFPGYRFWTPLWEGGEGGLWQEELDLLRHRYKETGTEPTVLARAIFHVNLEVIYGATPHSDHRLIHS